MVQIITYEPGGLAALLTRPQRPRARSRLNITGYCASDWVLLLLTP